MGSSGGALKMSNVTTKLTVSAREYWKSSREAYAYRTQLSGRGIHPDQPNRDLNLTGPYIVAQLCNQQNWGFRDEGDLIAFKAFYKEQ